MGDDGLTTKLPQRVLYLSFEGSELRTRIFRTHVGLKVMSAHWSAVDSKCARKLRARSSEPPKNLRIQSIEIAV